LALTGKEPEPTIKMKIKILTFAQTRTQLGFSELAVDYAATETPREILRRIAPQFDRAKPSALP